MGRGKLPAPPQPLPRAEPSPCTAQLEQNTSSPHLLHSTHTNTHLIRGMCGDRGREGGILLQQESSQGFGRAPAPGICLPLIALLWVDPEECRKKRAVFT